MFLIFLTLCRPYHLVEVDDPAYFLSMLPVSTAIKQVILVVSFPELHSHVEESEIADLKLSSFNIES